MEGVHGGVDLVVDVEAIVGLAELRFDDEFAEEGGVGVATAGDALVAVHHVVVDGREGGALVVVPERLRVGDDALVGEGAVACARLDPAGGDANLLVVAEAVDVGAEHPFGVEAVGEDHVARSVGYLDLIDRPLQDLFEADEVEIDAQVACQDFVDGEDLVQPAHGRVDGLLGPFHGRVVAAEADEDLADVGAFQPRPHALVEPVVALLEG